MSNKGCEESCCKILCRLWECRDLEIEHYWHRMVFMTAFLVLTFASYGGLFTCACNSDGKLTFGMFNFISIFICIIGIVVSCLWIMMSKGSKAWQEQYEKVIKSFCYDDLLCEELKNRFKCNRVHYASGEYDKIKEIEKIEINDFLWSTKAGAYSVSKVGIFIGQFSLFVWSVILFFHVYLYAGNISYKCVVTLIEKSLTKDMLVLVCGFLLIFFWIVSKLILKSSFLNK